MRQDPDSILGPKMKQEAPNIESPVIPWFGLRGRRPLNLVRSPDFVQSRSPLYGPLPQPAVKSARVRARIPYRWLRADPARVSSGHGLLVDRERQL